MSKREDRVFGFYFLAFCFAYPVTPDFMVFGVSLILGDFPLFDYAPWHRALPVGFLLGSFVALLVLAKAAPRYRSMAWVFLSIGWMLCYLYMFSDESSAELASLAIVYVPYLALVALSALGAWFSHRERSVEP